ncbi:hypothetical protein ACFYVL_18900 [Streptomyces sp. NPDC004111]|uniref:hypothetical protein n=1 Tax=Streptomyces sp. NPDC004111 TaxID=3364690 RepID=UPI0036B644A7
MRETPARSRTRVRTAGAAVAAAAVLAVGGAGGVAHAENEGGQTLEFNPQTVSPGMEVAVSTTACGAGGSGTGDASALGVGEFTMETATHKEVLVGRFTVPSHTSKGEYSVTVTCADGVKSATGELWVTAGSPDDGHPTPSPSWSSSPSTPSGHVRTGVGGGTSGPGTPEIAAGAAVLAASAVGGGWLLLRRRAREAQQRG